MTPREDDRDWFQDQVLAFLPDMYATAQRLAKNRADAEDLVAEAVAKAWANLAALRDRDRFRGWLMRILTNAFVSGCRAAAVRPELRSPDEELAGEEHFSLFERLHQPFLLWWGNPEQEFLNKLLREDLEAAIDSLPEAFRVVVVLADSRASPITRSRRPWSCLSAPCDLASPGHVPGCRSRCGNTPRTPGSRAGRRTAERRHDERTAAARLRGGPEAPCRLPGRRARG